MPALTDKQQNFFKLVKAYKSKEVGDDEVTDKVKKVANSMKDTDIDDFVKESANGTYPSFNAHFAHIMQKPSTAVGDVSSLQVAPAAPSKNKTTYTGTAPLQSANTECDTNCDDSGAVATDGDLIAPSSTSTGIVTRELPSNLTKKFVHLIKDMSSRISEAQFNGQTVKLYVPFKIDHKTKKYGVYIKSLRDGQIIKVLFGSKDMIGDPLRKK